MNDDEERRKGHFFGMSFRIPLPWLLSILVMGLVQLGIFYQEFQNLSVVLKEVQVLLKETSIVSITQQQRLLEHDRRLDDHEHRIHEVERKR